MGNRAINNSNIEKKFSNVNLFTIIANSIDTLSAKACLNAVVCVFFFVAVDQFQRKRHLNN